MANFCGSEALDPTIIRFDRKRFSRIVDVAKAISTIAYRRGSSMRPLRAELFELLGGVH